MGTFHTIVAIGIMGGRWSTQNGEISGREVEPPNTHSGADHLFQHRRRTGRGPDCGDDFGLVRGNDTISRAVCYSESRCRSSFGLKSLPELTASITPW